MIALPLDSYSFSLELWHLGVYLPREIMKYVHSAIRHLLKSKGAGRHAHPGKFSYLQRLGLLWVASEATYTLIVQAKCKCTTVCEFYGVV